MQVLLVPLTVIKVIITSYGLYHDAHGIYSYRYLLVLT